jgi:hypothetical protein
MAIVFMITSLTLGYFAGKRPTASIFDTRSPAVESSAPEAVPTPTAPSERPPAP